MHEIYFAGEPSDGLGFFAISDDGEPTEYYPTKKALRAALADGSAFAFTLEPQPAILPPRPVAIENNERSRQAVLFSGLGCCKGQLDLISGA